LLPSERAATHFILAANIAYATVEKRFALPSVTTKAAPERRDSRPSHWLVFQIIKQLWSSIGALASRKKGVTLTHGQLQAAAVPPMFPPRTAAFFFDHVGAFVFSPRD
jgi:hypothetical protein